MRWMKRANRTESDGGSTRYESIIYATSIRSIDRALGCVGNDSFVRVWAERFSLFSVFLFFLFFLFFRETNDQNDRVDYELKINQG